MCACTDVAGPDNFHVILARIFHEDVLQAQQLGSWQGIADFEAAGNAVGIPFTGPERDL